MLRLDLYSNFFFLDGYIPVLNSPSSAKSSKPCIFDHGNHGSRLYPYINIYMPSQYLTLQLIYHRYQSQHIGLLNNNSKTKKMQKNYCRILKH